jgi:hypothetical protein
VANCAEGMGEIVRRCLHRNWGVEKIWKHTHALGPRMGSPNGEREATSIRDRCSDGWFAKCGTS